MLKNKLEIDPNEFAMNLIKGMVKQPEVTNQRFIKEQLTLYLESYYLIKDFNNLETSQFETMKDKQISELFDKMLIRRFNP
ncbi:hypothetical protein FC19_GL001165 [Liquorilactobacillus aquaticus DSM 21051]|uniref:Uncharacterized protein n=1 Tax=Liquorilactobacillus aquaticus DSM 21051 TaxID=1423725 RepID=A0A0R2CX04_9LACO|nr:hypothetical protein [Liquorilactobacillus aquaticus]KRM96096.1 hypothetical protein FC19_GL001165 [Liquorilactobacillus aquaticus DSM 21051]